MPFQLRVCFQYKHMGGIVDVHGTMLPEIQYRAGEAGATARKTCGMYGVKAMTRSFDAKHRHVFVDEERVEQPESV